MNRILLCGALGRMGYEVARAAKEYGFEIAAGIDASANKDAGFPLYAGFSDQIREEAEIYGLPVPEDTLTDVKEVTRISLN